MVQTTQVKLLIFWDPSQLMCCPAALAARRSGGTSLFLLSAVAPFLSSDVIWGAGGGGCLVSCIAFSKCRLLLLLIFTWVLFRFADVSVSVLFSLRVSCR